MNISGYFSEKLLEPLVFSGKISSETQKKCTYLARLWGLLHDIGHCPFSHVFDSAVLQKAKTDHEEIGVEIVQNSPELSIIFKKLSKDPGIEVEDICLAMMKEIPQDIEDLEKALLYVIRGPYSADVIDYLLRDSHHAGVREYGQVSWQRLILTSLIHNGKVVLEQRSEPALSSFYVSRHQMYNTVYYHRTCRAIDRMIRDMLEIEKDYLLKRTENLQLFSQFDEEELLQTLRNKKNDAGRIARDILNRSVWWKEVYTKETVFGEESFKDMISDQTYQSKQEQRIAGKLKSYSAGEDFFVDGAYLKESPLSPFAGVSSVTLFNPETGEAKEWSFDNYLGRAGFTFWIRVYKRAESSLSEETLYKTCVQVFGGSAETHH